MKMKGKSPMMKALVGNQKNLNEGLKAAIKAAPGKMMAKTPSVMERMKTAMKVRGMGEDAVGKVRGMGEKSPNKIMKEKAAAKIMKEKAVAKVAKPDFPDIDGDGDRKESITKAAADKKAKSPAKIKTMARGKRMISNQKEGLATKTVQKKRKKQEPITSVKPKPIPSVAKKEGEKGGRVSKTWDSPKDLQNATSMVMAKINKAMPAPSSRKKELAAKAKKLLSTGAIGNLDLLMGRNKISGDFTSFKGLTVTRK